jgi:pimeloyl-ACP methyl ester carboxylesterase
MPSVFASRARPTTPWRGREAGEDYGRTAEPSWRDVDWPAHLHQLPIGDVDVNHVDIGSGPGEPVVFIHGLAGQWQNWLENLPRVAQERRAIALDLPGHGQTGMPRERITIQGYGRLVDALCARLELERVVLVGNSMGGFVSSEVAIQFPERVERLVIVSAAGITTANVRRAPSMLAGRLSRAVTMYTLARHERIAKRPVMRHVALGLVARYPARLAADLSWEAMFKGAGKPGFDDALRACLEYDFRERLPEISCPALIIWGENDAVLPVQDAHEFERLIPDSRKLLMENTGHVPQLERPAAFNEALLEFLAETGRAEEREPAEGTSQAA